MSSNHGGLDELNTPFSSKTLPDGSSRLVARVIAHFASQAFGEGRAESWTQRESRHARRHTAPLSDHLRRALSD